MEGCEDPGVTRNTLKPAQRERAAEAGNERTLIQGERQSGGLMGENPSLSSCSYVSSHSFYVFKCKITLCLMSSVFEKLAEKMCQAW